MIHGFKNKKILPQFRRDGSLFFFPTSAPLSQLYTNAQLQPEKQSSILIASWRSNFVVQRKLGNKSLSHHVFELWHFALLHVFWKNAWLRLAVTMTVKEPSSLLYSLPLRVPPRCTPQPIGWPQNYWRAIDIHAIWIFSGKCGAVNH